MAFDPYFLREHSTYAVIIAIWYRVSTITQEFTKSSERVSSTPVLFDSSITDNLLIALKS